MRRCDASDPEDTGGLRNEGAARSVSCCIRQLLHFAGQLAVWLVRYKIIGVLVLFFLTCEARFIALLCRSNNGNGAGAC